MNRPWMTIEKDTETQAWFPVLNFDVTKTQLFMCEDIGTAIMVRNSAEKLLDYIWAAYNLDKK